MATSRVVAGFVAALEATFDAATRVAETEERWLDIAGLPVKLVLVGGTRPLVRPFQHLLRAPAEAASLTICAWDGASTGIPPLWGPGEWHRIRFENEAGIVLDANRLVTDVSDLTMAYTLYDRERARAYYTVPALASLRHQRAAPFHIPISWWARDAGLQLVHAAAVGRPDGGVLLAGRGGAGKSTTALACVHAGLGYAADDYCLTSVDSAPMVYSLFGSGKVLPSQAWRVPGLGVVAADEGEDKAALYLNERFPERMCKAMPLRAIFVPKVVPGLAQSRIEPISARDTLLALAPSTIFQLPHAGGRALANMTALVRRCPGYRLQLGHDTSEVATTIARFLERV